MQYLKLFVPTIVFALLLDMIWLGFIAKNMYDENIGMLLRKSGNSMAPNWPAAIIVYVAITIGILCFVLPRANGNYLLALSFGMLFGAVTYGIYDFTNFSILANWPLKITIVDFIWGMVLCGTTSTFALFIQRLISV